MNRSLIDEEQPQIESRAAYGWKSYYDLPGIYSWLDQMLEEFPNVLTNYNFGYSYENRTLRALKLSHKAVSKLF